MSNKDAVKIGVERSEPRPDQGEENLNRKGVIGNDWV